MAREDLLVILGTNELVMFKIGDPKKFPEPLGKLPLSQDPNDRFLEMAVLQGGNTLAALEVNDNRVVAISIADTDSVQSAVDRVVAELGGVHILVNNAGITRDNLLFKMTDEDWDQVIAVHLRGAFLMTRAAQKHFVAQKYGKILNLSSVSALGNRGQANYSAAKMGIQGFTRTLGIELGPFGVNANAVAPGFIATDMTGPVKEKYDKLIADGLTLERRWGEPEDVGRAVAALVRGDIPYATGQVLKIDGGMTIRTL